ncbi:hypothetical protein ACTJIJ_11750 [Niabella sp. 22666]|uniref:hypothetical protein n=1 Tax=Niabella sp. 22666 TaxID=3453954 RepID=UPI003F855CC0
MNNNNQKMSALPSQNEPAKYFTYFEVNNDALDNKTRYSLCKGDILKCIPAEVKNITPKKYFVLEINGGTCVSKWTRAKGAFMSNPLNPEYPAYKVNASEILQCYKVISTQRDIAPGIAR